MRKIYTILAESITSHPKAYLVFFASLLILCLYGTTMLSMDTSTDTYVDPLSTRGVILNNYQESFSADTIVLIIESSDVLSPENLRYIDRLLNEIQRNQNVDQVFGITNLITPYTGGIIPSTIGEIRSLKEKAPPDILKRFVPSPMMTLATITLKTGIGQEKQYEVLDEIDTLIRLSEQPVGLSVSVSGGPAFDKQMGEDIGKSMGTLIFAAMILMIIAVGLFFASVNARFLPVIIVFTGLFLTFGIVGLSGIKISMVVIAAFPVLIGIGIDYAIQFHSRLNEEALNYDTKTAVFRTISQFGPAILFAMLSTSLGFMAMLISPIPMIADFGLICVIGVFCCYITAVIGISLYALLIGYEGKAESKGGMNAALVHYDKVLGRLSGSIAKYPVIILIVLSLAAVIGMSMDSAIPINSDEKTFVPPDMPAVIENNKVKRTIGPTDSITIYVQGTNLLTPDVIKWIDEFGEYELRSKDAFTGVTSIATLLREYNGGELPLTSSEIQQVLLLIPSSEKDKFLDGNLNALISFSLRNITFNLGQDLILNLKNDLSFWIEPPVGVDARVTGQFEMFSHLIEEITRSKLSMTLLGFLLIFLFLAVLYRRLTAVSPIIPIIMIVGWNGMIMYLLGIDYTPMTATLGSMTIGVASEYTILIMERFEEERSAGLPTVEAIQTAIQKIGTAITLSGMSTVFGFSALLLSTFPMVSNFGLVTVITVGFSVTGAILVMPAILAFMTLIQEHCQSRRCKETI